MNTLLPQYSRLTISANRIEHLLGIVSSRFLNLLLLDMVCVACYAMRMIKSFRNKDTEELAGNRYVKQFDSIQDSARKKLEILKAAKGLEDLASVPGNRLESLSGTRNGQYSIRINDQYRICFVVGKNGFTDVEITDYH